MKNKETLKVFVCGDDPPVSREVQDRLAELGHTVVPGGGSADDIVHSVAGAKPDLVFVACTSPRDHGLGMVREIQRFHPVPLILLAEQTSPALLHKADSAGASWVLNVPADSSAIDSAIDFALVRHQDLLELRRLRERMKKTVREFVHRVKNDLSVITSLMHFQADSSRHFDTTTAILEGADRIRVISVLYDIIRSSESRDLLRLDYYLELLLSKISQGLPDESGISIEVSADSIFLDCASVLNCGLIIRELVVNAIKYAFPVNGKKKRIRVTVQKDTDDDIVEICVRDNGKGLPAGVDPALAATFGFQLVSFLVGQLKGTMKVTRSGGTMLRIRFKAPHETRAIP